MRKVPNTITSTLIVPSVGTSTTLVYDADGNLTGSGKLTNTWNYKDQLTQSLVKVGTSATTTNTYLYDQDGNRVKMVASATTTAYANNFYNLTNGAKKEKMIYAGDTLLATYETTGATTTTTKHYVHTDNVLGSNVISDSTGAKEELMDYYPFGSVRLDEKATTFDEQRKFIGQMYDSASSLSYLNARYYDGARGNFLSEDPSHLAIGNPNKLKQLTNQDQQTYLADPQQLNSYSYARDNPITKSDPTGRYFELSLSGVGGGWVFSGGLRFDLNGGLDIFASGGTGVGLQAGIEGMWSPGPVSNQRGSTITVSATVAEVVGGRVTKDVVSYDGTNRQGNVYPNTKPPSAGLVFGAGSSASLQQEFTYPILKSNQSSKANGTGIVVPVPLTNPKVQSPSTFGKTIPAIPQQTSQPTAAKNNNP
jgi:RHS repeat-associated protein